MHPSGEIGDLTIPWLLQELVAGKQTGTAVFEQESSVRNVYVRDGEILFASSNKNEDRLGEFLVRKGRITQTQFDTASAMVVKTKKKLGAVLYELGVLSPQELVSQVKLQVKQIVLDLFSWRSGRYRFENSLPADLMIPFRIDPSELIREGIEAVDWQTVRKIVPSLKTVLRPSAGFLGPAALSTDQKNVLQLVNGMRSIEDICSLAGIGDFNTLRTIYLLLALRFAEIGRTEAGEGAHSGVKTAAEATAVPVMTRKMVLDAFAALDHQDDFQVLGVNATMSVDELRRAYLRLAKTYHPDRHSGTEVGDLKAQLEAIFSRIHEAYQRLSGDAGPAEPKKQGAAGGEYEEKRAEEYVENYAEKAKQAAACFNAGMKDFEIGNFWGASDAFAAAMRLDSLKAPYHYYYGKSLSRIPRRKHEAEEHLKKAIEIDPLRPEYHLDLGDLYLRTGLKNKAIEVLTAALQTNPGSVPIAEALKTAGGLVPGKSGGRNDILKKMFKDDT